MGFCEIKNTINHPDKIVIHGSDVSWRKQRDQLVNINQYHKSLDFPLSYFGYYVGYHRLITNSRNIQCKLDSEVGAHTIGQNSNSLGICVGFDGDIEYPHPDDYILLKRQVLAWQDMYVIPNSQVYFHRHFNISKTCPGSLLGVEWLKELLRRESHSKPEEQEKKQIEILQQKISFLQRIINLYLKLKTLI